MTHPVYEFSGWVFDTAQRTLFRPNGMELPLTSTEFDVLLFLCQRPRRVILRQEFHERQDGSIIFQGDRSVDVKISRLRSKIEPDPRNPLYIKTVRTLARSTGGYYFAPEVKASHSAEQEECPPMVSGSAHGAPASYPDPTLGNVR